MKLFQLTIMILIASLALNFLSAEEVDPKELAKDWESLVTKMLLEKNKVIVHINGKEHRVVDIKAQNSILIIATDRKEKIAVSLPFVSKDRDGYSTGLYFIFEK